MPNDVSMSRRDPDTDICTGTSTSIDAAEGYFFALDAEANEIDATAPEAGQQQALVREVAVAFCYNGISHAVMMATPQDLEDFAYGFSLTSGVIRHRDQIVDLDVEIAHDSAMLHISLNQRALQQFRSSRRVMAGTSGCGICGVDALDQALNAPGPTLHPGFDELPTHAHLAELRTRFQRAQQHRDSRGAMHAALFVDDGGETRLCREDIGRHNALDKLIGAGIREGLDFSAGFVAITSRCSLELIQKSLYAGIGTLVSLASPSDIAVRWARQYRLNLLHQPAEGPARLFSGAPIEPLAPRNSSGE